MKLLFLETRFLLLPLKIRRKTMRRGMSCWSGIAAEQKIVRDVGRLWLKMKRFFRSQQSSKWRKTNKRSFLICKMPSGKSRLLFNCFNNCLFTSVLSSSIVYIQLPLKKSYHPLFIVTHGNISNLLKCPHERVAILRRTKGKGEKLPSTPRHTSQSRAKHKTSHSHHVPTMKFLE
ncbi:hypothetical protein FRX31_008259 [Thalictrum thalictroides]|uniref:Uncharacterized protein n=1 Tax=Thalictrum thalictroides TaxID=46969 RepID=A0A7J6WXJ4_THATH|nr:hypothetical protein FRX31_008259 [Thalictrum thalictroides]